MRHFCTLLRHKHHQQLQLGDRGDGEAELGGDADRHSLVVAERAVLRLRDRLREFHHVRH